MPACHGHTTLQFCLNNRKRGNNYEIWSGQAHACQIVKLLTNLRIRMFHKVIVLLE